jgi:hypothetical protein
VGINTSKKQFQLLPFFFLFFYTNESNELIHYKEHETERPKPLEEKRTKEPTKPNQKLRAALHEESRPFCCLTPKRPTVPMGDKPVLGRVT